MLTHKNQKDVALMPASPMRLTQPFIH